MSYRNPALVEVHRIAKQLREEKELLAEAVMRHEENTRNLQGDLDAAMVAAVDWGGLTTTEVARVAGYTAHNAVVAARKRINARNTKVR